MKIYVAHSRGYDYEKELYYPIRQMDNNNEIILPHENGKNEPHTREFYKELNCIIAECSYPATGLGIELGWAYDDQKPIYCIYKKGSKVSGSLHALTNQFMEYSDSIDLINVVGRIISTEEEKRKENKTK